VFQQANDCFNWLPLAAMIDSDIFCVHGGISSFLTNIQQINEFVRPISSYDHRLICDLVWSDPSATVQNYGTNSRGYGSAFGPEAVRHFLENQNIKWILRGHQCVAEGVECFANAVYTVFSSSHYEGFYENACGILYIDGAKELQSFTLPMLKQTPRDSAVFGTAVGGISEGKSKVGIGLQARRSTVDSRPRLRRNSVAAAASSHYRPMKGRCWELRNAFRDYILEKCCKEHFKKKEDPGNQILAFISQSVFP
jgi:diadenosine tetraphosphatase ApaH/serine/threonine PP2A family protein phosphatase